MGNLVRPESHPEPRGFPVQWADPGVKPAGDPSDRPSYEIKQQKIGVVELSGVVRCVTVFVCFSSSSLIISGKTRRKRGTETSAELLQ